VERRESSKVGVKRVGFLPAGAKNCTAVLEDELHAIPFPESQAVANLDWHRYLAFAADGAGSRHLYFTSLGKDFILYPASLQSLQVKTPKTKRTRGHRSSD
jgi:hypothetical protein